MIDLQSWPLLVTTPTSFAGGVLLGLVYFRAVRATADMIVAGGRPLLVVAATLGRLGLLSAGLVLALQAGALAVLAALAGILGGRALALRRPGGARP